MKDISNEDLEVMKEYVKHQDQYNTIALRGKVVKKLGKEKGFQVIEWLMKMYGDDLREINKQLREVLNE